MKSGNGNMDLVKNRSGSFFPDFLESARKSTRRALSAVFQYPINRTGEETVDIFNPSKVTDSDMNTEEINPMAGVRRTASSKVAVMTTRLGPSGGYDEKLDTL